MVDNLCIGEENIHTKVYILELLSTQILYTAPHFNKKNKNKEDQEEDGEKNYTLTIKLKEYIKYSLKKYNICCFS